MFKYIGDSIINASFTVQVPKPLDSRTVVNNITELYSIPSTYAYLGMTVANIDNGNIYMLVDKAKINEKAGWRASYESIQIIACTEADYKTWLSNTDENFNPIDQSADYVHQDTYYYIYEDSLSAESELQEYVKRSDWMELLNVVSGKASSDGLARTNQIVEGIIRDYATKQFVIDGYAPLSMFNLESAESFIRTNFFTKEEALGKFVKFSDLSGGEDIGEDDFIFVTASRYQQDQEALEQYKQGIADELADCLKVGDNGELDSITVGQIKSKKVDNEQLVIDVTPQGMSIGGDPIAKLSDVPDHVTLTKQEYDALVENDQVNPDTYYHIVGDDDTYVLQSDLDENYYTKSGVGSYLASWAYSKSQVDEIISQLSFNTPEEIANIYVTKVALADTLEDYVTIAMLGGDDMEGQFIFVKASDYQTDQEALAQQRETDLQNLENNYIQKDSDASLNSLETDTVKNGANILTIAEVLKFNNKNLALEEDVPVIQVVTQAEFEELTKDPNVYYFVYNTDENLAFVTAEELENYYTKPQIDSKLVAINQYSDFIKSDLFVQMSIKFNVEKILMERIADNQYYIARVSGNHIDITEYAPDQSVLTTTGTGLVSFLRHLITNDTELGNDVLTITLTYNNVSVTMTESGQSTDNPSTVTIQLVTFLRQATGKATGDIKQSDLNGKILDMRVAKDTVYVDYKVAIKGQQS